MRKERRRAVHAELVRESKDNPGYFRYNITIRELDGREHIVPAYGVDMEDAIERLVWNERVDKVSNKQGVLASFALLILSIVGVSGVLAVIHDNPLWVIGGIGVCAVILSFIAIADNYLRKK